MITASSGRMLKEERTIGEPCEGKPHARFDEGMLETGQEATATAPVFYSTEVRDSEIPIQSVPTEFRRYRPN